MQNTEQIIEGIEKKVLQELGCDYIEKSSGYPWNGWCCYDNGYCSFRAGLWSEYLQRLKEEFEQYGLTNTNKYQEIVEELKMIEEEWQRVTA
jgi:hypothetical protein